MKCRKGLVPIVTRLEDKKEGVGDSEEGMDGKGKKDLGSGRREERGRGRRE